MIGAPAEIDSTDTLIEPSVLKFSFGITSPYIFLFGSLDSITEGTMRLFPVGTPLYP